MFVELILPAIGLGILLSLVLIGPVFFLLIETSITKGVRAAITLDMGVILADVICILVAYHSSYDLAEYIKNHPALYRIGGFIIIIYGTYMILSKGNHKINEKGVIATNYWKTFMNGFLLNLVNIGVVAFWLSTVLIISTQFPQKMEFAIFISIVLLTFISIDLLKIFLAQSFKKRLTNSLVRKIKSTLGIILVAFGVVIFIKSYGVFNKIENQIQFIDNSP